MDIYGTDHSKTKHPNTELENVRFSNGFGFWMDSVFEWSVFEPWLYLYKNSYYIFLQSKDSLILSKSFKLLPLRVSNVIMTKTLQYSWDPNTILVKNKSSFVFKWHRSTGQFVIWILDWHLDSWKSHVTCRLIYLFML